ncbi:unnamed protein product, partial [Laminaria digitata]
PPSPATGGVTGAKLRPSSGPTSSSSPGAAVFAELRKPLLLAWNVSFAPPPIEETLSAAMSMDGVGGDHKAEKSGIRHSRHANEPSGSGGANPGNGPGPSGGGVRTSGKSVDTPGSSAGTFGEYAGAFFQGVGTPGESVGTPGEAVGTSGEKGADTSGESVGTFGQGAGTFGQRVGALSVETPSRGDGSGREAVAVDVRRLRTPVWARLFFADRKRILQVRARASLARAATGNISPASSAQNETRERPDPGRDSAVVDRVPGGNAGPAVVVAATHDRDNEAVGDGGRGSSVCYPRQCVLQAATQAGTFADVARFSLNVPTRDKATTPPPPPPPQAQATALADPDDDGNRK